MSRGKWKNPPREKPRVRAPKFPEDSMSRVTRLTSGEEFVLLGMSATVTFSNSDGKGKVGIDRVQEGSYQNGTWSGGRWLNGDQTHQGRHVHFDAGRWTVQRVKLYRY